MSAWIMSGLKMWVSESWKNIQLCHKSREVKLKTWFWDKILKNWSKCGCGLLEGWVKCWRLWAISETSANPLFVMLITAENLMNENKRAFTEKILVLPAKKTQLRACWYNINLINYKKYSTSFLSCKCSDMSEKQYLEGTFELSGDRFVLFINIGS